jgi:hypothetical protein
MILCAIDRISSAIAPNYAANIYFFFCVCLSVRVLCQKSTAPYLPGACRASQREYCTISCAIDCIRSAIVPNQTAKYLLYFTGCASLYECCVEKAQRYTPRLPMVSYPEFCTILCPIDRMMSAIAPN